MTVKNADYIKTVNATYRATGSIGPKAIVPKLVPGVAKKTDRILDFGAGTKAIHTMALRQQGYNVTAFDIGANIDPAIHDPNALAKRWDVVYASNVLNVQPSPADLISLVMLLADLVKKGGTLIANYPPSPRKSGLPVATVDTILQSHFATVTRVPKVSSPTWICKR